MQKHKHIKYTKLSPIMSKTIPSPVELSFCRTLNPRGIGLDDFFIFSLICFALIGSLESPPSISLKATRKPGCTGLVRDSQVRDWLWLGKVLAPLKHPT